MVLRDKLIEWLNEYLNANNFIDYCPNGLQLEGISEINKISCAVSSSQMMIDEAIKSKSDMLLVHHGFIWKGDMKTLTGPYLNKVKAALNHNLNIVAYHLPLDAHMEIGNAISLANMLKLEETEPFFKYKDNNIGVRGVATLKNKEFLDIIDSEINDKAIHLMNREINQVGIVTGAGHSEFENAIESGIDTFITGEHTEWIYHMAQEYSVNFISAGHHATERFGVRNLGKKINETFSAKIEYLDEMNPF